MPRDLYASYLITLVTLLVAIGGLLFLPPLIPLWYTISLPEQRLAPKLYILLFPITLFVLSAVHTFIVHRLRTMDSIIIRIFSYGTTLVSFLFFISLIHIIYLFI